MTISKSIRGLFIAAVMILFFAGCATSDSNSDVRALENVVNSLKDNVTALQNSMTEMKSKNDALESELQVLKTEVNSLKMTTR